MSKYSFSFFAGILFFLGSICSCQNRIDYIVTKTEPLSLQSQLNPGQSIQIFSFFQQDQQLLFYRAVNPSLNSFEFSTWDLTTNQFTNRFLISLPKEFSDPNPLLDITFSADEKILYLLAFDPNHKLFVIPIDFTTKMTMTPILIKPPAQTSLQNISFAGSHNFVTGIAVETKTTSPRKQRFVSNFLDINQTTFTSPFSLEIPDHLFLISADQKFLVEVSQEQAKLLLYQLGTDLPLNKIISLPPSFQTDSIIQSTNSETGYFFLLTPKSSGNKSNHLVELDHQFSFVQETTYEHKDWTAWSSMATSKSSQNIALQNENEPGIVYLRKPSEPTYQKLFLGGHSTPLRYAEPMDENRVLTIDEKGASLGWSFSSANEPLHQISISGGQASEAPFPNLTKLNSNLIVTLNSSFFSTYQKTESTEEIPKIQLLRQFYENDFKNENFFSQFISAISTPAQEATISSGDQMPSKSDRILFTAYSDGTIKKWLFPSSLQPDSLDSPLKSLQKITTDLGYITAIGASPGGGCIIAGNQQGQTELRCSAHVFESEPFFLVSKTSDLKNKVQQLLWSPNGKWIFGYDDQGNTALWETTTTALQNSLLPNPSLIAGASWVGSDTLAIILQNGTLVLWADGSMIQQQSLGQQYYRASFTDIENGKMALLILNDRFSIQRVYIKPM